MSTRLLALAISVGSVLAWVAVPASAVAASPSIESESVSHITESDATLEAHINPEGLETTYEFLLAPPEPRCLEANPPCMIPQHEPLRLPGGTLPASSVGQGVSLDLNGAGVTLVPGAEYKYWVVATNTAGTTQGPEQRFTTLSSAPPSIESESVSHITPTDATLEAQINTQGLETTYEFQLRSPLCSPPAQCIPIISYPLPSGKLLGSFIGQSVSLDLNSAGVTLQPGKEYFYSVTATSRAGTTESHSQTFTTPSEPGAEPLNEPGASSNTDPQSVPQSSPSASASAPHRRRSHHRKHHRRRLRHSVY